MRAGTLRHRVSIQRPIITENEYGEPETNEWQTIATRRARVSPLEGRERWNAQQIYAEVTHEVEIRHLEGVKAEWRVDFNGRVLDIEAAINPDERGRRLVLLCTERVE